MHDRSRTAGRLGRGALTSDGKTETAADREPARTRTPNRTGPAATPSEANERVSALPISQTLDVGSCGRSGSARYRGLVESRRSNRRVCGVRRRERIRRAGVAR